MSNLQLNVKISIQEVKEFSNKTLLNRSVQTTLNSHINTLIDDIEIEVGHNIIKEMNEFLERLRYDDEIFTNGRESETKQED